MKYQGQSLFLDETSLREPSNSFSLDDLPNPEPKHPCRLEKTSSLLERLWRVALRDVESNIIHQEGETYFGAGAKFGAFLYTRDIAFSGILGLNRLYPDIIRSSLIRTRELRLRAGFCVPRGHAVRELDAPWSDDLELETFLKTFGGTHGISRRSDDIVWLWCAHDLVRKTNREKDWRWLFTYGRRCFEELYSYFRDPSDGLYRGQAAFIDIHWPNRKTTGYPDNWQLADCLLIKALSTNCLYVLGLAAMAEAAQRLGQDPKPWKRQAEELRAAIRDNFLAADGRYRYYRDRQGRLSERREALGTALLFPAGVVSRDEATACVLDYPVTEQGAPLFVPFFDGD
ncbi:MAG: hypothetical protein ACP5I4_16740, partial [Oceanipulchritudo sp.]